MITLITGGARSGKSSFAEKIAEKRGGKEVYYLATAEIKDEEMQKRVQKHIKQRPEEWNTIEAPYKMGESISHLPSGAVLLIDCITIYISNLIFEDQKTEINLEEKEIRVKKEIKQIIEIIRKQDMKAIMVTNEVGQGIVPAYKSGRIYRDIAGRINQYLAKQADEVYITFAGLPVEIKQIGQKNLDNFQN